MVHPSLAPEIWDAIIDHLHDEQMALSACALVHRAWNARAHFHLFNRVIIDYDHDDPDLLSDFFARSGRAIVPYVQDLRISGKHGEVESDNFEGDDGGTHSNHFPVAKLPKFPSVTSLTFTCMENWEDLSETTRRWLTDHIAGLRTLRICMEFQDFGNILPLISSATCLKALDFNYENSIRAAHQSQQARSLFECFRPSGIRDLAVGFTSISDVDGDHPVVLLIEWLKIHGIRDNLRTFQLSGDWSHILEIIARCLDETLPFIEHLGIDADDPLNLYLSCQEMTLTSARRLQSITLVITFNRPFKHMLEFLSSIPSSVLRLVTFEITISDAEWKHIVPFEGLRIEGNHNLSELDGYFSDVSPSASVQSAFVRFVCYPTRHPRGDVSLFVGLPEYIQQYLPRLNSQKRVSVEIRNENTTFWF